MSKSKGEARAGGGVGSSGRVSAQEALGGKGQSKEMKALLNNKDKSKTKVVNWSSATNADKIKMAEMMFGTNSKKHLQAKKKYK